MTIIFVSVAVMFIIFAAMAVGVIFSNKPIKGTCGGLNKFREGDCEICGGNPDKCEKFDDERSLESKAETPKAHDVMKQK